MPPGTTRETARLMLRRMLADRFGLKVHTEEKTIPIYALVVAKSGFKLKPVEYPGSLQIRGGSGYFTASAMPIARLAVYLGTVVDRPVIDATGVEGAYKIDLRWTPDYDDAGPRGTARKDRGIIGLIEGLLGLRLEGRKLPVSMLVVDHVERTPTPN